jgi:hypothetical protein
MPDNVGVTRVRVQLAAGADADSEDLDALTRELREEIAQLDVESVELAKTASAPPGTKSAEALALGALWIGLMPVAVPKLLDILQAWTFRGENRTVKVSARIGPRAVEVEYAPGVTSKEEVTRLVEELTDMLTCQPGSSAEPGTERGGT